MRRSQNLAERSELVHGAEHHFSVAPVLDRLEVDHCVGVVEHKKGLVPAHELHLGTGRGQGFRLGRVDLDDLTRSVSPGRRFVLVLEAAPDHDGDPTRAHRQTRIDS